MQFATEKHPELPHVPLVTDLARNDRERNALTLILSQQAMGRPFAAPPGVPAARVAALRGAFARAVADPEFLAEADKQQLEIKLVEGEVLQEHGRAHVQGAARGRRRRAGGHRALTFRVACCRCCGLGYSSGQDHRSGGPR